MEKNSFSYGRGFDPPIEYELVDEVILTLDALYGSVRDDWTASGMRIAIKEAIKERIYHDS